MAQETMPGEGLWMFSFPPWDAEKDSWDEYLRAMEEAYAQHRRESGEREEVNQTAHDAAPAAPTVEHVVRAEPR